MKVSFYPCNKIKNENLVGVHGQCQYVNFFFWVDHFNIVFVLDVSLTIVGSFFRSGDVTVTVEYISKQLSLHSWRSYIPTMVGETSSTKVSLTRSNPRRRIHNENLIWTSKHSKKKKSKDKKLPKNNMIWEKKKRELLHTQK